MPTFHTIYFLKSTLFYIIHTFDPNLNSRNAWLANTVTGTTAQQPPRPDMAGVKQFRD